MRTTLALSLKPKPEQARLIGCVNEIMSHLRDLLSTEVDPFVDIHRSKFEKALVTQPAPVTLENPRATKVDSLQIY